jgi:hypothetical protein
MQHTQLIVFLASITEKVMRAYYSYWCCPR